MSLGAILLIVLSLYFAPLVGALRGSVREMARVNRRIELRKRREESIRGRSVEQDGTGIPHQG
jgi:hypothetical protein